jgi:hypothetical protein
VLVMVNISKAFKKFAKNEFLQHENGSKRIGLLVYSGLVFKSYALP